MTVDLDDDDNDDDASIYQPLRTSLSNFKWGLTGLNLEFSF